LPASLATLLCRGEWETLLRAAQAARPAHELAAALRPQDGEGAADRRIIIALQTLVAKGVLWVQR
jgi:hypothetical protein